MSDRGIDGVPGSHGGRAHLQAPSCPLSHWAHPQCPAPYTVPGSIQLKGTWRWVEKSLLSVAWRGLRAPYGLPKRNSAPYVLAQAPSTEISERFLWVSALGCET